MKITQGPRYNYTVYLKLFLIVPLLLMLACQPVRKNASNNTITASEEVVSDPGSLIGRWEGADDRSIYFDFKDSKKVIGSDGCNQFFGHYTSNGSDITFTAISSTKKACQDQYIIPIIINLDSISSYSISEDVLTFNLRGGPFLSLKKDE